MANKTYSDLSGKRFGNLTVRDRAPNVGVKTAWECLCDCGNRVVVRSDALKNRKHCGCRKSESTDKIVVDVSGMKFGRLVVIRRDGKFGSQIGWLCRCDCGSEVRVSGTRLRSGHTKSCGCLQREKATAQAVRIGKANRKHGMTSTAEWLAWKNMRDRCENPADASYDNYGGRGIKVCERWQAFENFYADVGPRPSTKHSLDRYPNQNGDYEPGNVRWATGVEQQRNRRDNVLVTFNGETLCVSEWAGKMGIGRQRLWKRLKSGWTVEQAMTTPVRRGNTKIGYKKVTH